MVSHSAVAGGMNAVIESLIRHRPDGVEIRWVFLEPGLTTEACPVPWAVIERGRMRHVWRWAGTVGALRGAIRTAGADLVFAHVTTAHLYAAAAARLEGVPYLWWQHERFGQKPLMHTIAGHVRARAVICSADYTAAEQRARFPATPVVRIHPGASTRGLEEPPRRPRDDGDVVFGVVGRLQRWKRPELAIRAMPAVVAEVPGARLRIVGEAAPGLDDDYPGELKAEAVRLGVADAVEFTGHVADGAAAIGELDVLVHCADFEPFGLAVVEAMLRGVACVVPDYGGPRETIRDGVDGLSLDPADTPRLAAAMLALGTNPDLRAAMGAAARDRALAHFTEERMAEQAWAVACAVAEGRDPR